VGSALRALAHPTLAQPLPQPPTKTANRLVTQLAVSQPRGAVQIGCHRNFQMNEQIEVSYVDAATAKVWG
jgi:hypothetical protein